MIKPVSNEILELLKTLHYSSVRASYRDQFTGQALQALLKMDKNFDYLGLLDKTGGPEGLALATIRLADAMAKVATLYEQIEERQTKQEEKQNKLKEGNKENG